MKTPKKAQVRETRTSSESALRCVFDRLLLMHAGVVGLIDVVPSKLQPSRSYVVYDEVCVFSRSNIRTHARLTHTRTHTHTHCTHNAHALAQEELLHSQCEVMSSVARTVQNSFVSICCIPGIVIDLLCVCVCVCSTVLAPATRVPSSGISNGTRR